MMFGNSLGIEKQNSRTAAERAADASAFAGEKLSELKTQGQELFTNLFSKLS